MGRPAQRPPATGSARISIIASRASAMRAPPVFIKAKYFVQQSFMFREYTKRGGFVKCGMDIYVKFKIVCL
jgi:hypothetical protein